MRVDGLSFRPQKTAVRLSFVLKFEVPLWRHAASAWLTWIAAKVDVEIRF